MNDMRPPLAKVRGLGSAKEGTDHFWRQRLTAFANIPLFAFFIFLIAYCFGEDYESTKQIISNPFILILLALMCLSGIYHMKLGMQVIIEDYVHGHSLRVLCLFLNIFFCFFMGASCLLSLIKIGLGG